MKISDRLARCEAYGIGFRCLVAAFLFAFAAAAAAAAGDTGLLSDINYRLGDGLRIPGVGLTIGGYATGTYARPKHLPARAALDDFSISLWWEGAERWKVFSEFDYENPVSSRSPKTRDEDRYLAIERFYVDYALNDTTTLRAGKFLTPIGHWNLVHATPLVWTTSRPLVTVRAFPTNVTGLMLSGSFPLAGNDVEYSVYGSNGNEFRPNPAVDTFNDALGTHLSVQGPMGSRMGFSLVSFEQAKTVGERKQLVGIDFLWIYKRFEVSAEGVYRLSDDGSSRTERGSFVQIVAPLSDRLYAVGRYENYRPALQVGATQLVVAGLNYRITQAAVVKLEWVHVTHNLIGAPQGFISSLSVLF